MRNLKIDFPIFDTTIHGEKFVYLDSAATAQKPEAVIDMISELYRTCNSNIHRGIHFMAEQTTTKYEDARQKVCDFINARSTSEIIFTSGATASINLVAYSFGEQNFKQGDNIVVSEMEHHSNIVPWQMVAQRKGVEIRVLPFDDSGELVISKLSELLDEKTKIVAVTQTSNVLGTENNLTEIIQIAHSAGVPVLVDGCQGIVHSCVDVQMLDADFYCFSGHKLYGPTGIGVLYGKEKLLDNMPPFLGGGDMIAHVAFEETSFAPLPLKFEAGTSNFIDAIALGTAIDYLNSLPDMAEIHGNIKKLNSHFAAVLESEIEGARIFGISKSKAPITSFSIDGVHPSDLAMIIDKLGVAIRSGTHCAEPTMKHFGVNYMSRASFGIYNDKEDVELAMSAIKKAVMMLR